MAAGLLANLDEFTGDPNLTPAEWKHKDFVEGAQVPYRDAKGATYGYSWEGGAMVMGLSRMDLMEKKGLKDSKNLCRAAAGLRRDQWHRWRHRPGQFPASSLVPAAVHPGFWRQHFPQSAHRHHAGAELAGSGPGDRILANLLKNYAPKGVLTYTEDQARQALLTGRSNIFIHSSAWITPILLSGEAR